MTLSLYMYKFGGSMNEILVWCIGGTTVPLYRRKYYAWWPFCGFTVDKNNPHETCLFLRYVQITVALRKNAYSQASRLHHVVTVIEIVQFGYFICLEYLWISYKLTDYEGWNFNFGNTPLDWIQELLEWRANAAGRMGPSPTYIRNGSGPSRNRHTQ